MTSVWFPFAAVVFAATLAGPGVAGETSREEILARAMVSPSKTIRNLAAGQDQHIVAYGTSLTYGGAWVEDLRNRLNRHFPCRVLMTNTGVGGMASPAGLRRLERRVLRINPDCVLLEFAINDAYEGYEIPVDACRRNLETMIDRIEAHDADCEIILMTTNPTVGKPSEVRPHLVEYYEVYREVAAARGLLLVDHYRNWLRVLREHREAFDRFIPDGLHPASLGCRIVITPGILDVLGLEGGFAESLEAYVRTRSSTE